MQSFNRYLPKISIGLAGGALVVLAVIVLTPSPAPAQPVISWVPESVIANVTPGESKTIPVIFTSLENIDNVTVRLVPELEPFVRTEPTSFPSLVAGQATDLSVIVSADSNPAFGVYNGTIQLRTRRNLARPLPVNVTVSVVPVPPDPGEAGKATLEGIDSDNDGVRDDIQRYIVLTYPESERTRAALTQEAKALQQALADADNEDKSVVNVKKIFDAKACLRAIQQNSEEARMIQDRLRAEFLNTEERANAYFRFDDQLGGHSFDLVRGTSRCDFNPDEMRD